MLANLDTRPTSTPFTGYTARLGVFSRAQVAPFRRAAITENDDAMSILLTWIIHSAVLGWKIANREGDEVGTRRIFVVDQSGCICE